MLKTEITETEKDLLQAYVRTTKLVLIRYKSQAVLLSSQGVNPGAIQMAVNRQTRTVSGWLKDWQKQRMASIFSGHASNHNASKLTPEQLLEVKALLSQPPSDYGIPKAMWDVPTLKDYVSTHFEVVYESDESYYFLLRFAGLSFKYPDTFDRKRDESLINERMQAIRAEIKPLLHREDWEVFTADEVKMQQDAIIRRCWLKRGERTVIKVDRDKQSQSYLGLLNQKTHQCYLYELGWQNSEEVLKAMEQFLKSYPDKRIAIIWDNAAFHKSQRIKDALKRHGVMDRVHLIAMPPYAPDHNPIEHVWNTAKQKVANIQRNTFEETKKAFYDFVTERSFRYSI